MSQKLFGLDHCALTNFSLCSEQFVVSEDLHLKVFQINDESYLQWIHEIRPPELHLCFEKNTQKMFAKRQME